MDKTKRIISPADAQSYFPIEPGVTVPYVVSYIVPITSSTSAHDNDGAVQGEWFKIHRDTIGNNSIPNKKSNPDDLQVVPRTDKNPEPYHV